MASNLQQRLNQHRYYTLQLRAGTQKIDEGFYPRYEWAANHGALAVVGAPSS